MGEVQSRGPITDKSTYDNRFNNLRYGVCEMQGWRRTMEDASIAISNIDNKNSCLFGIMDGHGGPVISKFVAYNFKDFLVNWSAFKSGDYEQALIETYLKLDECWKNDEVNEFLINTLYNQTPDASPNKDTEFNRNDLTKLRFNQSTWYFQLYKQKQNTSNNSWIAWTMGTTANIVLIVNNSWYVANCGDSWSVMYKNGKAVKLNQEHKTTLKSEYERIVKVGGHIVNNRIEGKLNLTRAIGDLQFKNAKECKFYEQSVTAYPEIVKIKSLEDVEFIVMACDGWWDCVEPQKLCESIAKRLRADNQRKISDIICEFFDTVISKTNDTPIGTDNMSCIIIQMIGQGGAKIQSIAGWKAEKIMINT